MPLSADPAVVKNSEELVSTLKAAFNTPPGFRPAHAKGLVVEGSFKPTAAAAALSSAPHFAKETPVIARFSSSTGIPNIPDTDGNANPRGFAIRFVLGDHVHTDIISHSTPFFPVRTGQGFLDLLHAIGGGTIGEFLEANPAAKAFVTAPKPFPAALEKESYFGINAFKFINKEGKETFVRYQIHPTVPEEFLTDDQVATKGPEYLFDGVKETLSKGTIALKVFAQIAEDGDTLNDATVHWPAERKVVELGTVTLNKVAADSLTEQKKIIFDPIPRVQGIEPSDDPLLDTRATLYLISGKERRAA